MLLHEAGHSRGRGARQEGETSADKRCHSPPLLSRRSRWGRIPRTGERRTGGLAEGLDIRPGEDWRTTRRTTREFEPEFEWSSSRGTTRSSSRSSSGARAGVRLGARAGVREERSRAGARANGVRAEFKNDSEEDSSDSSDSSEAASQGICVNTPAMLWQDEASISPPNTHTVSAGGVLLAG